MPTEAVPLTEHQESLFPRLSQTKVGDDVTYNTEFKIATIIIQFLDGKFDRTMGLHWGGWV